MSRRQIRVVGAMLEKEGGRYLITQRRPGASLPLLWEFPGGRVQEGESDAEALARELNEEMGVRVRVGEQVMHLRHDYPDYEIDFRVFRCSLPTACTSRSCSRRLGPSRRWLPRSTAAGPAPAT